MKPNRLLTLMDNRENDLRNTLAISRTDGHAPTAGSLSQGKWCNMLSDLLPSRYQISKEAQIIDSEGAESGSIDIVIHDRQYCPLIFKDEDRHYIPVEAVYAVFEVKQTLKGEMEDAHKHAKEVRTLAPKVRSFPTASGNMHKEPVRVLAGILSLESGWSPPLGNPFEKQIALADEDEQLDLVCAAEDGAADIRYGISPGPSYTKNEGRPVSAFSFSLLIRLQELATVPAIDFSAYAKWLTEVETS